MAEDLEQTLRDNAQGPAKVSGDSGSMEQHKPTEQIAADKYLASKAAAGGPKLGIRLVKLSPPGAE